MIVLTADADAVFMAVMDILPGVLDLIQVDQLGVEAVTATVSFYYFNQGQPNA